MVRKRPLTPEEKHLWEHVTRHDKPLDETQQLAPKARPVKIKNIKSLPIPSPVQERNLAQDSKPKKLGNYAGIDRNTAERFRKGDAPIDARLDLHGMTSEKAHKALVAFIKQQIKLENRRLLVITGKGSGILRSSLPNWLTTANLGEHILAFDVAKPKHGGDGAYYILLKRKRP